MEIEEREMRGSIRKFSHSSHWSPVWFMSKLSYINYYPDHYVQAELPVKYEIIGIVFSQMRHEANYNRFSRRKLLLLKLGDLFNELDSILTSANRISTSELLKLIHMIEFYTH